nr:transcriptional regulator [Streptomyces arboris]
MRESLEVSDSVLSKHLKVLEEAGYVEVSKAPGASHPHTCIALTSESRRALAGDLPLPLAGWQVLLHVLAERRPDP